MSESPAALHRFQRMVLDDVALLEELRRCLDRPGFVALVVERARDHGCEVAQAEVETALKLGLQAWLMRWIGR